MYSHSNDLAKSLRLAPGIDYTAWEAVSAYQPSDTLYDVLDQEMGELAETARDLLSGRAVGPAQELREGGSPPEGSGALLSRMSNIQECAV